MVIGLAQLPSKTFSIPLISIPTPWESYRGCFTPGGQRCLIGIGGSATNDGGFGMAVALGWQFLDAAGRTIEKWTDLKKLESIVAPEASGSFEKVTVAVDVQNPLLGKMARAESTDRRRACSPAIF